MKTKRFWKCLIEWKVSACVVYTAAMFFYLFFCTAFGNQQISLLMLWTLFVVSAASTLIQGICFSDWIFKKMRYTRRSLLFVTLFLPLLAIAAWKAEWFPMEEPGAWVTFVGIFFLIFIVMTAGFDIYFQIVGRKYDGLLGQYRREKEEKGE